MGDFEGARRKLFVAMTASALLACGRTELSSLWDDVLGGTGASGGALATGSAGVGAAAGAAGHGGSAGPGGGASPGGTNGIVGSAGSPLGGGAGMAHGGGAGAGGSEHALAACDRIATPILDGPLAIQTEGRPATSVAGDWNRDGKLDLATGNTDGGVSVLFGRGDGSFASSVTYPSGLDALAEPDRQGSIAVSDLDGNGSLDLVLDQRQGVSVLLGAADGSFAPAITYPLENALAGLALGDFDGDGDTDIALGSRSDAVVVLPNSGDGTFGLGLATPFGDRVKYISAGDLNHDGRLDVVALGETETTVLLGNGHGRFVKTQQFETDFYDGSVKLADFDADGHLDFARTLGCGPPDGDTSRVELWLGQGDGTFRNGAWSHLSGICVYRLTVADVNGDGAVDVLPSPLTVLLGQQADSFAPLITSSKAGGGELLGVGDWNGDGKPDLATASDGWVGVHLGNGDGSFGSSRVYATTAAPGTLALADFDADGQLDVATTTANYWRHGGADSTALDVLLGVGDGSFLNHVAHPTPLPAREPAAVDLNRDGWLDVVTLTDSSSIGVHLGTGNASFAPEATSVVGSDYMASFAVGDLNGDGNPDVVATIAWTKQLSLLFGAGDGTFAPLHLLDLPDHPAAAAVVDVDGDSKQDIVVTHFEAKTVEVLLGNGDGSFRPGQQYLTGGSPARITPADLNADGNVDLVTWGIAWSSDSLSVLLGAGDGSFSSWLDYPGKFVELAALDFNRDGHQDLVTVHDSGITLLFGVGDGTFACVTRYVGGAMRGLGVSDLNHDGRMDVVTTTKEGVNVFLNSTP